MRIAIIADPLDNQSAGVHVYTKGMVMALGQYDQENEYILIREKKDPDLPFPMRQVVIPNFRFLLFFASFRLFILLPIILRRLKVDAVVEPAHFGPFNLPSKIKRITVIHDMTPFLFPHYHRWHGQLLQRIFLGRILKKTHLILSVSKNTAEDLVRIFPFAQAKIKVIYPGRDPFFRPSESTAVLSKWNIQKPYFLGVGTIEPRKNLLLLMEAYTSFRSQTEEKVSLVLVGGKGWKYKAFYQSLAAHPYKEDILCLGYVEKSDLPTMYSHAKAFIYPSLYEGFGLPVLEALACGARVICGDRSSLPEVGGEVACYFDPEDKEALVQQLIAAFHEEKTKLIQESRIHQAETFSWEQYVSDFKNEIEI